LDIQLLNSVEDFAKAAEKHKSFFLLKHSLTCDISKGAKDEYEKFAQFTDTPLYMLYVQEARPLSNDIAEKYEVKHESPQALLFQDNKIIWNASHRAITEQALKDAEKQNIE
jgi:bacillithiol system protein YtxJ